MSFRTLAVVLMALLCTVSAAEAKSKPESNCRQLVLFGFSAGGHIVQSSIPFGAPFNHSIVAVPAYCRPRR
jgi:cytochrome c556